MLCKFEQRNISVYHHLCFIYLCEFTFNITFLLEHLKYIFYPFVNSNFAFNFLASKVKYLKIARYYNFVNITFVFIIDYGFLRRGYSLMKTPTIPKRNYTFLTCLRNIHATRGLISYCEGFDSQGFKLNSRPRNRALIYML